MVDVPALRGELAKNNVSQTEMAKKLGIAPKTFYLKMKTGKFGVDEALIISETLKLENPTNIFFAKE